MKRRIYIAILFTFTLVACSENRLPNTKYSESYDKRNIPVIISYKDGSLRVNDSIINDVSDFHFRYIGTLPGFEYNLRHCLLSLDIDKRTTFNKIDSIFRVLESGRFHTVFLLVNDVKDTVGFHLHIPLYSYSPPEKYRLPDTISIDNFIQLYNDSTVINGRKMNLPEIDTKLKEIVHKKQRAYLLIDETASYESVIILLEKYHMHRQYFKDLYSELNFNRNYGWLMMYPKYNYNRIEEIDQVYKNRLILVDSEKLSDKTIITLGK